MPATDLPLPFTPADQTHMARALALAEGAIALSEPNPRVGCVITSADGRVLGEGFTQQAGGPHAEIMALRDAATHGEDVRGATAYVTLYGAYTECEGEDRNDGERRRSSQAPDSSSASC